MKSRTELPVKAYKGEGVGEWEKKKKQRGEEGRERMLQKPLLLHLHLLFYGNQINRAVSSMTNQNKARGFLHDRLYAGSLVKKYS